MAEPMQGHERFCFRKLDGDCSCGFDAQQREAGRPRALPPSGVYHMEYVDADHVRLTLVEESTLFSVRADNHLNRKDNG